MGFVPGYKYDLFVGYSTGFFSPENDNRAINADLKAFIIQLIAQIRRRETDYEAQVAVDHYYLADDRGPGTDQWRKDIAALLWESALFLALDCDSWRGKGACQWEVREFLKIIEEDGGRGPRIIAEEVAPVTHDAEPDDDDRRRLPEDEVQHLNREPVFKASNAHQLWVKSAKNDWVFSTNPSQAEYVEAVGELAAKIVGYLKRLREWRKPPRDKGLVGKIQNDRILRRANRSAYLPPPPAEWNDLYQALARQLGSPGAERCEFVDSPAEAWFAVHFLPRTDDDHAWQAFGRCLQVAVKSDLTLILVCPELPVPGARRARLSTGGAMIDSILAEKAKGAKRLYLTPADAGDVAASVERIVAQLGTTEDLSGAAAQARQYARRRRNILLLHDRSMDELNLAQELASELKERAGAESCCQLYDKFLGDSRLTEPADDAVCILGQFAPEDPFDDRLNSLRTRLRGLDVGRKLMLVVPPEKKHVNEKWLSVPKSTFRDYSHVADEELKSRLVSDVHAELASGGAGGS